MSRHSSASALTGGASTETHLIADNSQKDVLIVRAAPAQDVQALLVALPAKLVDSVLRAMRNTKGGLVIQSHLCGSFQQVSAVAVK